jgi:hypothetical protein
MSITQKSTPNYTAGRGGNTIKKIVIHHMVGTIEGADKTFQDTVRQTSAHYGVARDGRTWQWVAESSTAWHAGSFTVNQQSIGIEHEDLAHDDFTETLYQTSARLIAEICNRYGLPINANTIIPHRSIVATQCPGTIDLAKLISMANNQGDDMATDALTKEEIIVAHRGFFFADPPKSTIDYYVGKPNSQMLTDFENSTGRKEIESEWAAYNSGTKPTVLAPGDYRVK